MIRKLVAIILAILINCAVLPCFHAWSANAVANAASSQSTHEVRVLPVITVRPTRAQLEMLRRGSRPVDAIPQKQGAA